MDLLKANVEEMEAQLKLWTVKIDELSATAQKSNEWARIDFRQYIDDLKVKRALVRAKLDKFEATEIENRKSLRVGLMRVWKELANALEKMKF